MREVDAKRPEGVNNVPSVSLTLNSSLREGANFPEAFS